MMLYGFFSFVFFFSYNIHKNPTPPPPPSRPPCITTFTYSCFWWTFQNWWSKTIHLIGSQIENGLTKMFKSLVQIDLFERIIQRWICLKIPILMGEKLDEMFFAINLKYKLSSSSRNLNGKLRKGRGEWESSRLFIYRNEKLLMGLI